MKIDTTTLLIAGAAAVGVYMLTRPRVTTPTYPLGYNPYTGTALNYTNPATSQNYLGQDLQAGGTALEGLSSVIANFF